jgi:hypothetical protein
MNLDYESLNLEEIEQIEDLTGFTFDEIIGGKVSKGKFFRAIIFVIKKRTNPAFTYAETAKLTLNDALTMMEGSADDPKE